MRCNNILDSIGHTPLVRLNRLTAGFAADVYVKVDYMNPGGSVKDRIGISMIDDAERKGLLKPGGTIIEGTSGNTGIGLALVGAVRGYKLVFTITEYVSRVDNRATPTPRCPSPSKCWIPKRSTRSRSRAASSS